MNIDDKQKAVIEYAKKYGFTAQDTGGNCGALQLHVTEDIYFMITDDAEIPEYISDDVVFGIYTGDRQIFFTVMEAQFAFYMSQKIANVLTSNTFSVKLNFDIAEVADWLQKNNHENQQPPNN